MIGRRVSTNQDIQIRVLQIFQLNSPRSRADARPQSDAAGLMAVVTAVVDVIRAKQP